MDKQILNKLNKLNIKQVIIWGHKLHSHTHSYIHNAWNKFFKYLNISVLWLDNNDNIEEIKFDNSLFFSEGQVDQNIPLNYNNSYYILHNCNIIKYKKLIENKKVLLLDKFINTLRDKFKLHEFNNLKYHHYVPNNIYLAMPWASDLTPNEIDINIKKFSKKNFKNEANFIGSIWEDPSNKDFTNKPQINMFIDSCRKNNIEFKHYQNISVEKNIELIQQTKYSPSIQGKWQCDYGYIPCRIFKNISYGGIPITNNKEIYDLFNKKIVFNKNIDKLIEDTNDFFDEKSDYDFKELMKYVRDNHTYLNRINVYLDFIIYINDNNITNPDIKFLNNFHNFI